MNSIFRFLSVIAILTVSGIACKPSKTPPPEKTPTPKTTETTLLQTPARTGTSANPLAEFIRRSVPDEFNPDVTDEARRNPKPRRGGTLNARLAGNLFTLNPLLVSWREEAYITENLLLDPLIALHSETLEYLPKLAAYYEVRDYIEKSDGTRIEGLITTQSAESVTIAPGVNLWTFLRTELTSSDTAKGTFQTRYGHTLHGKATTYEYTVAIEESPATPPVTISVSELSTWVNQIGAREEKRPSIKPRCVFEIKMREGVKWHDGHPVTMVDAKTWFDTLRNPRVDCARLRSYYVDIEKMELLDNMTAKFTCAKPYFKALGFCGSINLLPSHILHTELLEDDPDGYAEEFNKHPLGLPGKGTFIGTGPYKLVNWEAQKEVVLERNEAYWADNADLGYWMKGQPFIDKIVFHFIENKTAALREMEIGNIDFDIDIEPDTWLLPATNSPEFSSKIVRAKHPTASFTYIGWNMERDLFKDRRVRRAMTMLIPRERILREIHHGLGTIAVGPFYRNAPWADPTVEQIPFDPEGAKKLLREARWIDRDGDGILDKDGKKFEFEYLIHTAREYHSKIADLIKDYLGQANIQVNIRKVDVTIMRETAADHNFDAMRMAWGAVPNPDPYQIWHSSQRLNRGDNYCSYVNPEVDRIIEQAREVFDPFKRWKMDQEFFRIVHDDQPYTFLFHFDEMAFYNRKLRGVKFYAFDPSYDFTEWWFAE